MGRRGVGCGPPPGGRRRRRPLVPRRALGPRGLRGGPHPGRRVRRSRPGWPARPSPAGRHPLPDPAGSPGRWPSWASATTTVVAYDDAGGVNAGRLVWMLRVSATGRRCSTAASRPGPGRSRPRPRGRPRDFTARRGPPTGSPAWTRSRAGLPSCSTRATEPLRRELEPVDPRPGHIPGARSMPVREHLDPDGRFLEPGDAARAVRPGGRRRDRGRHLLLRLGRHRVPQPARVGGTPALAGRLYPGSWSQWSNSARPVATGNA